MYRSIEAAMAAEFAVDMLALWAALRPVARLRICRLIFAAALGAVFSGVVLLYSPAPHIRILSCVVTVPALIYVCTGRQSLAFMAGASAGMLTVSALISCVIHIFADIGFPKLIGAALAASLTASLLSGAYRRWLDNWETRITVSSNSNSVSFTALIDTGNCLAEPLSGLPVILAEESLLRSILPDSFDPADTSLLPKGFRLTAYGSVGGNGMLGCFMPDELYAGDSLLTGIWIAVYPGKLPGRYRALAPPSIISSIKTIPKRRNK